MAIITRPPRTISDIKTHSGRASRDHQIYRDYFQVGALELERWRRTLERNVAASRIACIDSRITDIDKEKEALLTGASASFAAVYSNDKSEPAENKRSSGLRIKY